MTPCEDKKTPETRYGCIYRIGSVPVQECLDFISRHLSNFTHELCQIDGESMLKITVTDPDMPPKRIRRALYSLVQYLEERRVRDSWRGK